MDRDPILVKDHAAVQSGSPIMSCRETIKKKSPYSSLRVPTAGCDSPERMRTHTSAGKSKSSNLQVTMRKPIKIKMFEKDTEKMKVMCFEFPVDGATAFL